MSSKNDRNKETAYETLEYETKSRLAHAMKVSKKYWGNHDVSSRGKNSKVTKTFTILCMGKLFGH